eukprot:1774359-Pyramimonas_sp.AAC.2
MHAIRRRHQQLRASATLNISSIASSDPVRNSGADYAGGADATAAAAAAAADEHVGGGCTAAAAAAAAAGSFGWRRGLRPCTLALGAARPSRRPPRASCAGRAPGRTPPP